jgi:hypothetical protein
MKRQRAWMLVGLAVAALTALPLALRAEPAAAPAIVGPADPGAWRSRIQPVFDPVTRTLARRSYTVWDIASARDLDFVWSPDDFAADRPGRITGNGHLLWRMRDKPTYDRAGVVVEYRGALRSGRMEGFGSYLDVTGLMYEGQWRAGLMDGHGTLKLPDGDEYVGAFRAGKANGRGVFVDVRGEIYEGPFVNGRRHGRGTTTLPNGRSYPSLWVAGRESERSRLVRVVQAGPSLPDSSDDIRISVGVDRRLPPATAVGNSPSWGSVFWYAASNTPAGVQIRPQNKRLMDLWQGKGELQLSWNEELAELRRGVLGVSKEELSPLNLRIEVQNRSANPVQVAGVYLDVQNSVSDNKPAIQVSTGSVDSCYGMARYSPGLTLENFGWGAAERASLRLSVAGPQAGAFDVTKDLGRLDRTLRVDLERDLAAAGVDTNYLARLEKGFSCGSKVLNQCLRELQATRRLGKLAEHVELQETSFVLRLRSVLEYSWRDAKGNSVNWSHPFTTRLPLGYFRHMHDCGEMANVQTVTSKAQQFRLDAAGYRIPVSFQTTVPPGRTSPLALPVEAEKSSAHEFVVVLQLANGREVRSRPVALNWYRPAWFAAPRDADGPSDEQKYFTHRDFVGPDLRQMANTDSFKCSQACDAEATCKGSSHDSWNERCFLKRAITSTRFDPRFYATLKEGTARPPELTDAKVMQRYDNKVFPDEPYLIDQRSTVETCEARCTREDACVAFTFKKRAGNCYLYGFVRPSESNPDGASGIKQQPAK